MPVNWLDEQTFQVELELIEPPPEYGLAECGPIEFIHGIEEGLIPLIFTSRFTMKVEKVGFVEIDREHRNATRAERKAYLEQYRKYCRGGNAHSRRIFFVLPECMDIRDGVVVFKHKYFKKGEKHA